MRGKNLDAFALGYFAVWNPKTQKWVFTPPGSADTPSADRLADIFEQKKSAIVLIRDGPTEKDAKPIGSGFVVSNTGLILTNRHVIEGAPQGKVLVQFSDGTKVAGKVRKEHGTYDLACVELIGRAPDLNVLEFAGNAAKAGTQAMAIGHPRGSEWSFVGMRISSIRQKEGGTAYIQLDGSVNGGMSGGPLLDVDGRVLGVIEAKFVGKNIEGLGLAVPGAVAKKFMEEILQGK